MHQREPEATNPVVPQGKSNNRFIEIESGTISMSSVDGNHNKVDPRLNSNVGMRLTFSVDSLRKNVGNCLIKTTRSNLATFCSLEVFYSFEPGDLSLNFWCICLNGESLSLSEKTLLEK